MVNQNNETEYKRSNQTWFPVEKCENESRKVRKMVFGDSIPARDPFPSSLTPKILIVVVPHGRKAFFDHGIDGKAPEPGTDDSGKLPRDGAVLHKGSVAHASVDGC